MKPESDSIFYLLSSWLKLQLGEKFVVTLGGQHVCFLLGGINTKSHGRPPHNQKHHSIWMTASPESQRPSPSSPPSSLRHQALSDRENTWRCHLLGLSVWNMHAPHCEAPTATALLLFFFFFSEDVTATGTWHKKKTKTSHRYISSVNLLRHWHSLTWW